MAFILFYQIILINISSPFFQYALLFITVTHVSVTGAVGLYFPICLSILEVLSE